MANVAVPPQAQNAPSENPVMGLYLDRPAHTIDPKGFQACNNVRVELGRVRSDLIGWTPTSIPQLPGPAIYGDSFISSIPGVFSDFVVTPTDIYNLNSGTPTLITPTYTYGYASVEEGANEVAGVNTRWASDIQLGATQDVQQLTRDAAEGATTLYIGEPSNAWLPGMNIFDVTNDGYLLNGTYITGFFPSSTSGASYVTISQPLQSAVTASADYFQVGSGITLRANVRPGDQIAFGQTNPNFEGLTWYTVQSVSSDTTLYLTSNASSTQSNVPYVIRQCLTNTVDSPSPFLPECSSDNYQFAAGFNGVGTGTSADLWFFTNGLDPIVVYYSTTGTCQYSLSIPFTAACLKAFKGLMCFGNITSDGEIFATSIASSDSGLPQQMNSGVAFQGIATSGPFQITRLAVLGSVLMIYCSALAVGNAGNSDNLGGSATSASFVGSPTIWSFSDVIQTRGPIVGGLVAVFPDRHQMLSFDGEYRYNGLFVQIMNDQVWREAMKTFDQSRPWAAFSALIPTYGDLIWAFPQTSDPSGQLFASSAYVEHYMEQANSYLFKPITMRDFPFTFVSLSINQGASATFDSTSTFGSVNLTFQTIGQVGGQPLFYAGDTSGDLWFLYSSNTQNGTAPTCSVQWGSRPIGNGRARQLVTRVYPEIEYIAEPAGNVNVTLTMQDSAAGPVTLTDTQTFNPSYPNGLRFTTHYRRGRQAAVTISDSSGIGWVCDGYDWDYVAGGVR